MDQKRRKYDSTVARIAGNILSGLRSSSNGSNLQDLREVRWAVRMARAVVAEVERTEINPERFEISAK
jgi:hypothetical protein